MGLTDGIRVARSVIAADALVAMLEDHYDLPSPITCRLRLSGDNDTYLVRAGDTRYVLRIYFPRYWIRCEADYRFELDWLAFLRTLNVPVSCAVPRRDGDLLGRVAAPEGTRHWVLFNTWGRYANGTRRNRRLCRRSSSRTWSRPSRSRSVSRARGGRSGG